LGLILVDIHGALLLRTACKACASNQFYFATDQGLRHFMSATEPWQRRTDDSSESYDQSRTRSAAQARPTILLVASIRDFTAATDLSNIAFSSALNSTSTIRSTPSSPMTTGTPM